MAREVYKIPDNSIVYLYKRRSEEMRNLGIDDRDFHRATVSLYDEKGKRLREIKIGCGSPSRSGDCFFLSVEHLHNSFLELLLGERIKLRVRNLLALNQKRNKSEFSPSIHAFNEEDFFVAVSYFTNKPATVSFLNKNPNRVILFYNTKNCKNPHIVSKTTTTQKTEYFFFMVSNSPEIHINLFEPHYYVSTEHSRKNKPSSLYYFTRTGSLGKIPLLTYENKEQLIMEMKEKAAAAKAERLKEIEKKRIEAEAARAAKVWEKEVHAAISEGIERKKERTKPKNVTPQTRPNNEKKAKGETRSKRVSPVLRFVLDNNGKVTLEDIQRATGIMDTPALVAKLESLGINGTRYNDGVIRYSKR